MAHSSRPQAILFDVDGVLIDSLTVKGEAFADVFDDIPDSRQTVVDFHLAHGGVTRSVKIANLHQQLLGIAPDSQDLDVRVRRFAERVRQRVIDAPEVPGARAALERWSERCPLHAVSATPNDEVFEILAARGVAGFFMSIHGWPPAKGDIVVSVLEQNTYEPRQTILVGDSHEDLTAALHAGAQFVHFQAPGAPSLEGTHQVISRHTQLDRAIEQALHRPSV